MTKQKKLKDVLLELMKIDPEVRHTKQAIVLIVLVSFLILVIFLFEVSQALKSTYGLVNRYSSLASIPKAEPVGGPDHTPLGEGFLHTEGDSTCDEGHWRLEGGRAIATYATSTKTGTSFQFDFTPTGVYAANIQFGRSRVYEVSLGANSYEYLLVKNLQDDSNVGLYDQENSIRKGRLNLGFALSSTTPNTVRIEEVVISENLMKLKITLSGKEFETEDFQVNNHKKYQVVYFGLLDTSKDKDNKTGLLAPELRICP